MEGSFPAEGVETTTILVVNDVVRSRDFYRDALGAEIYREYGGTFYVLSFAPPTDGDYEIRCFFRNPYVYLFESSWKESRLRLC